jgi:hypothetical protein
MLLAAPAREKKIVLTLSPHALDAARRAPLGAIADDHVVCLECGKGFHQLDMHLHQTHRMEPWEYRERWGYGEGQSLRSHALQKRLARPSAARPGREDGRRKPLDRAALVEAWRGGAGAAELARLFSCTVPLIRLRLAEEIGLAVDGRLPQMAELRRAAGLVPLPGEVAAEERPRRGGRRRAVIDLEKVRKLLGAGLAVTQIAEEVGCAPHTLRRRMDEEGLTPARRAYPRRPRKVLLDKSPSARPGESAVIDRILRQAAEIHGDVERLRPAVRRLLRLWPKRNEGFVTWCKARVRVREKGWISLFGESFAANQPEGRPARILLGNGHLHVGEGPSRMSFDIPRAGLRIRRIKPKRLPFLLGVMKLVIHPGGAAFFAGRRFQFDPRLMGKGVLVLFFPKSDELLFVDQNGARVLPSNELAWADRMVGERKGDAESERRSLSPAILEEKAVAWLLDRWREEGHTFASHGRTVVTEAVIPWEGTAFTRLTMGWMRRDGRKIAVIAVRGPVGRCVLRITGPWMETLDLDGNSVDVRRLDHDVGWEFERSRPYRGNRLVRVTLRPLPGEVPPYLVVNVGTRSWYVNFPKSLRGRASHPALLIVERWGAPAVFTLYRDDKAPVGLEATIRDSSNLGVRRQEREGNVLAMGLDGPLERLAHLVPLAVHDRVLLALELLAPAVQALAVREMPAVGRRMAETMKSVAAALIETVSERISTIASTAQAQAAVEGLRLVEALEQACALAQSLASCATSQIGGAVPAQRAHGRFALRHSPAGTDAGFLELSSRPLLMTLTLLDLRLTARRLLAARECPAELEEFAALLASRTWDEAVSDLAAQPQAASRLARHRLGEAARLEIGWENGAAIVVMHLPLLPDLLGRVGSRLDGATVDASGFLWARKEERPSTEALMNRVQDDLTKRLPRG